jgi:hypothetical protein
MSKNRGYWTKEKCAELAGQCSSRKELSEKSRTCYTTSHRKGWLDEICSHMETAKKAKPNYWTKDNCRKEALKYITRSEFEKNNLGAYTKARRENWLDEICEHMSFRERGAQGLKKLYTLYWPDLNMVYIGISNNPNRRLSDHLKKSSNHLVQQLILKDKLPQFEIISDWLNFSEVTELEKETIRKYRNDSWDVLNIAKGGALGGTTVKWTKDKCFEQARKYTNRGAFEANESGCYKAALRLGIYEEICSHMNYIKRPNGHWTIANCLKEALKYTSRTKFCRGSGGAYNECLKNGWLNEVCAHMQDHGISYSYDECLDAAKKYSSRNSFEKHEKFKYKYAKKKGWIQSICTHMPAYTPKKYWTYENCKVEALKYSRRMDLEKNASRVIQLIRENGWVELLSHMEKPHKSRVYWTEERLSEEIRKYPTKKLMWENNSKCMQAINRLKLGHLFDLK